MTTPDCTTKTCPKCKRSLPRSAFWKNKRQPSGLQTACKDCHRERVKRTPGRHARSVLNWQISYGNMSKASERKCEDCGIQAEHYHHEDYAKPLDVVPLCQACHTKRHNQEAH